MQTKFIWYELGTSGFLNSVIWSQTKPEHTLNWQKQKNCQSIWSMNSGHIKDYPLNIGNDIKIKLSRKITQKVVRKV